MRFFAWLARVVLLGIATFSVGVWVLLMTAQSTVLNRDVAKGWLASSGAYDHVLDSVVNLQNIGQGSSTLDQVSLQKAVGNTLTPVFIRQVTETVLDSSYDWLQGKTATITFSIPLDAKRAELQSQLATALAPELKGLPACTSGFSGLTSSDVKCLPQGTNANDAAASTAKQSIDGTDFLSQPLTQDALGPINLQSWAWLPAIVQQVGLLVIVLPIAAVICGAGYVLLSKRRIAGGRALAGHLLFGSAIGTLAGASLWYFGGGLQLSQVSDQASQAALLKDVVQPIFAQVLPGIGFWLTVFSGGIALASAVAWVTLIILSKRHVASTLTDVPPLDSPKPQPIVATAKVEPATEKPLPAAIIDKK